MLATALICGAVGLGLSYLPRVDAAESLLRSLHKTLPVAMLALAALIAGAPLWLVAALVASALGDWALSRAGDRLFLVGMLAFAVAHLWYVIGMAGLTATVSIPALVLVGGLLLSTEVWLSPHTGVFKQPVRAYVLIIGAMAVAAFSLPAGFVLAKAGAALFVLSDLLIAIEKFRLQQPRKAISVSIWLTYLAAQALLLIGLAGTPIQTL